jgi:hypothetical protein
VTAKTEYIARLVANVPDELKVLAIWLLWKSVQRKGKEKPSKIPYYVSGAIRGKDLELDCPEDRAQLVTFDDAVAAYKVGSYTGVGVALGKVGDKIVSGIDLDDILLDDDRAIQVVSKADSYTEKSPSRTGVKVFGIGDIGSVSESDQHLELYSSGRFFTVTGESLDVSSELHDLRAAASLAKGLFLKQPVGPANGEAIPSVANLVTAKRHNYLAKTAGRYRDIGMSEAEILASLRVHNDNNCDPPLPDDEVVGIAHWAGKKPSPDALAERTPLQFQGFTVEELEKPIREERYMLPGIPVEAYALVAGSLASYKTLLLMYMTIWRATGYDLLGLTPGSLDAVVKVGDVGPCVGLWFEDVDWRIVARFQRILQHGATLIKDCHGASAANEFLALAAKNIRRLPLSGTIGNTIVVREGNYIVPNYRMIEEVLTGIRAFTSEGVLIGIDPLRLSIQGSQNDDDGADTVIQVLNGMSTAVPDSALVIISHTSKQGAKETARNFADASYATSGSALYSQHARSNFLLERLQSSDIAKLFDLTSEEVDRQTVAKLTHGRLSHGAESMDAYIHMRGGLLAVIEPRSANTTAKDTIDRSLPLVAKALDRLAKDNTPASQNALVQDAALAKHLAKGPKLREILNLLEESELIKFTGTTVDRKGWVTDRGRERLEKLGTSRNESSPGDL